MQKGTICRKFPNQEYRFPKPSCLAKIKGKQPMKNRSLGVMIGFLTGNNRKRVQLNYFLSLRVVSEKVKIVTSRSTDFMSYLTES